MTPQQADSVYKRARCLYNRDQVDAAIERLAQQITAALATANPLLLTIMQGGVVLAGKLAPRLAFPLQMDYLHATRYRGATSGADLQWRARPSEPLRDRTVLLLDDILDEGATLAGVKDWCREQGCGALYTAVLVNKRHQRKVTGAEADFIGLEAEDSYLFGYGMDFKGYLRNAPGIYAVHESDLAS